MIYIAHRGNIAGPNPEFENRVEYIQSALTQGYECEIDVWFDHGWFLGHDYPQYPIDSQFLTTPRLWIHCKNDKALYQMSKHVYTRFHYFWHQEDDYTITSKGYIWTYPGKQLLLNSICVLPEIASYKNLKCAGICSDFIEKYKND